MPASTQMMSPSRRNRSVVTVGIGEVAVHGPWSELAGRGHHLPDRIDAVGRGAQFEHPAQERRAQVDLADAGPQDLARVDHREFVEQLRVTDTGHLVRCLGELGRADHVGRVDPVEIRQCRSIGCV